MDSPACLSSLAVSLFQVWETHSGAGCVRAEPDGAPLASGAVRLRPRGSATICSVPYGLFDGATSC